MARYSSADIEEAKTRLRAWFPKDSTAYTVLRHAAASGMSRRISVMSIRPDDERAGDVVIRLDDHNIETILGKRHRTDEGVLVKVQGAGMDMGFWLVYELASALYDDGYALKHQWL